MIVSPNKIIGSLVYRTREALGRDANFLEGLQSYPYHSNCLVDGRFLMWHYPGTAEEISSALLKIGELPNGARLKFPAILNYQTIRQDRAGETVTIHYNLAIVGSVDDTWMTEQREKKVFDPVLRPIYVEFMRQIRGSGYFQLGYGGPQHTCYEVFTTGGNFSELKNFYGECIDAIELHDLTLTLLPALCKKKLAEIERENALVTSDINEILTL